MKVRELINYLEQFPDNDKVKMTIFEVKPFYDNGECFTSDLCEGISYDTGQVSLLNVKGDMV
jgi:hypothetical protein